VRNIANLDLSIYWTFTVSSALELPADLLTIWGLDALGRRWSACLSQALAAAFMLAAALVQDSPWLAAALAMAGRFCITYAMNTGTQITYEIVPTAMRGQGNAIANVFAQMAQFFSPYIVYTVRARARMRLRGMDIIFRFFFRARLWGSRRRFSYWPQAP